MKIKIRTKIVLLSLSLLLSCNEQQEYQEYQITESINSNGRLEKQYFKEGQLSRIVTYYPKGIIRSEQEYDNGRMKGEYRFYYENGNIAQSGFRENGLRKGYFYHYYEVDSGKIRLLSYIFNVGQKEYASFQRYYNLEGILLNEESDLKFNNLKDSIKSNTEVTYEIIIPHQFLGDSSYFISGEFYDDFSPDSTTLDTLLIYQDRIDRSFISSEIGLNKIQGKVLTYKSELNSEDTLTTIEIHIPFERPIIVY